MMRRFIIKSFGIVFSSLIVLFVIFLLCLNIENPYAKASHEINLVESMVKLDTISVPKIVILGGSGCGFGIDSRAISEHFGMPVVNTGTHAGLGLRLQLELFEEYILKDDIVLVIPEYDNFSKLYFWGNETALRILSTTYPAGYRQCSCIQLLYLLTFSPKHYFNAIRFRNQGLVPDAQSPYSQYSLNKFGDVTQYEERVHQEIEIYNKLKCNNPFVRSYLVAFNNSITKRGANMLLLPACLSVSSFEKSEEFINRVDRLYNNGGELRFIASPRRYAFPDTLFYDTPYHMTYEGVELRTALMIEDIDIALNEVVRYNN